MMTRFERELRGEYGLYWQKEAEKALKETQKELDKGKITIDENGVPINCIGRVVTDDILIQLTYLTDKVDVQAARDAREEETARELENYRRHAKDPSPEELYEMQAAFGKGVTVVNVLTGKSITL